MISSACHTVCLSVIRLRSFQVVWPGSLIRWGPGAVLRSESSYNSSPAWARSRWASAPTRLFKNLDQANLHAAEFPGQTVTVLALKMSKGTDWKYYLDAEGRNSDYRNPHAGCCKSLPSFVSVRFSVVKPHRFSHNLQGVRLQCRLPRSNPSAKGAGCPL